MDSDELETPLVRELLELKQEIIKQMDITEHLTSQAKGNRKSYLEVESANILKQRRLKEDQKQQSMELRLGDDKMDSMSPIDGDGDVVNEVTVVSEDVAQDDEDNNHSTDDDDSKKNKNNKFKTPSTKKSEESK